MDNVIFIISALLTVTGALCVLLTKNVMHACVYLLTCLLGVAGLYVTLGADFVAATQLAVYVGGVVILMVFAVMLTGGPTSQSSNKFGIVKVPMMGNAKTYIIGIISAVIFALMAYKVLSRIIISIQAGELPAFTETVEKIGFMLVTDHVLAFEISSVLLLGALVGAAIIARPRRGV